MFGNITEVGLVLCNKPSACPISWRAVAKKLFAPGACGTKTAAGLLLKSMLLPSGAVLASVTDPVLGFGPPKFWAPSMMSALEPSGKSLLKLTADLLLHKLNAVCSSD